MQYFLVPKNLEALRKIEEMAKDNALISETNEQKATFVNTASARGTSASANVKIGVINDFTPIEKTSETYLELTGGNRQKLEETTNAEGKVIRDTPNNISTVDINQYIMKYKVVLNKGKEKLNEAARSRRRTSTAQTSPSSSRVSR